MRNEKYQDLRIDSSVTRASSKAITLYSINKYIKYMVYPLALKAAEVSPSPRVSLYWGEC